jgi:hypothetical protein
MRKRAGVECVPCTVLRHSDAQTIEREWEADRRGRSDSLASSPCSSSLSLAWALRLLVYHPFGTDPLHSLKVKVSEALMPLSHLIVSMSSKAEELCHPHVEDIESIGVFGYLSKKATMTIPNPHDSVIDLHT